MRRLSRRARWLLVIVIGLIIVAGIAPRLFGVRFAGPPPTIVDIYYADEPDIRRSLDIYLPTDDGLPVPVAIMLHGNRGDKTNFRYTADQLNAHGFAVVLPNYRIDPITYSDAFCALAWIHANAEQYGLDANQLYVIGWSSGAVLLSKCLPPTILTNSWKIVPTRPRLSGWMVPSYSPLVPTVGRKVVGEPRKPL